MQAFFLPGHAGQRFCLYYPARSKSARGAVIYLHPFAEEMNKSRRMAALQSRAMADAGFDVLQMDLLGCGDSSGDFADASWQAWKEDVVLAHRWLRSRSQAPLTLWGLRAGCLVAAIAAVDLPERANFIFWQPVVSGKLHWQQFMRLKMAGELAGGQVKGMAEQMRQQLASGHSVEIAGYTISPLLAGGLENADLAPPVVPQKKSSARSTVVWLELSTRSEAIIAPASQKCINQWQAAGYQIQSAVINGPGFWQTTEIEEVPALISGTLAALESMS